MSTNTSLPNEHHGHLVRSDEEWKRILTAQQFAVLRKGATDPRNIGLTDHFADSGIYVCAGCATPLYESHMKFPCTCGWCAFNSNVPKNVMEKPKSAGAVEIVCRGCLGHLGHIFRSAAPSLNRPTERHCVNSSSIKFVEMSLDEYAKTRSNQSDKKHADAEKFA